MMVVLSPTPTATPGFWRSCIRKIRSSPAINATGEKMSPWSTPLAMSNGSESVIVPSGCLKRTTPVAREDSLHDATHLSSDSCLCEGLIQKHLTLSVECRTVVNKRYYSLSAFPENHLYKPLKGADIVPATSCRPEPSLCIG